MKYSRKHTSNLDITNNRMCIPKYKSEFAKSVGNDKIIALVSCLYF